MWLDEVMPGYKAMIGNVLVQRLLTKCRTLGASLSKQLKATSIG